MRLCVALAGFDDIAESAHVAPALTTVRLPGQAIGEAAVQRLAALIDGAGGADDRPSKTVLYTELIVRESSGAGRLSATA